MFTIYAIMKTKIFIYSALITCITITNSYAQNLKQKLDQNFNTLTNHTSLKNGIASIHIINSETKETIFEKNANIGLPTASTLKVITSITALDILGKDFTYKTKLYYTGEIDSIGILHGDIIIQGDGDPTLGSNRYENTKENVILSKWKSAIINAGITTINGKIIADDRKYNGHDLPGGWIWNDMGNYYGAGISSLNWRENSTGINFKVGDIQKSADLLNTTSDISYLKVINQVKTGRQGSGDNVYGYSAPYSEKIVLKGTYGVDLKKTIEVSLPDPAYDLAYNLKLALEKDNIYTTEGITTGQRMTEDNDHISAQPYTELDIHISPPLHEIVYWFNQKSINLYGEALLKSIAYFSGGKTSTQDGTFYLKKYWEQKLNIKNSELDLKDGSGLSPQNNVTTKAMNTIMQYAIGRPWFNEFNKSLPTYNNMTMKSGTIGGTLGYTGYHTAKDGKKYTFSLLVYNYDNTASRMRQLMFTFLDSLK